MQCFVIMCLSLGGVFVQTTHRDPQLGDNRRTETPHLFKREEDHHSRYKDNFTLRACAQCSKRQKITTGDPVFVSCDDNDDDGNNDL